MSSFRSRKDLYSDPTEQTLQPHHPRGVVTDAVWISFEPVYSGHDFLLATTPGIVHRIRSILSLSTSWRHSTPLGEMDCGSCWGNMDAPKKFTTMIERLHTGMMVNVRNGGEVSDTFAITYFYDKQGCVLDPTVFSICLSAILQQDFRHMGDGVYINSPQNADLFTVSHFRWKIKNRNTLVRERLFYRRQRITRPLSKWDPEDCWCVC